MILHARIRKGAKFGKLFLPSRLGVWLEIFDVFFFAFFARFAVKYLDSG